MARMFFRLIILCFCFGFLFPSLSFADDFHVTTDQELQTALSTVNITAGNHSIFLAAGTYTSAFSTPLTTCSALSIQPEAGLNPGQVVFDGQNGHRCLYLNAEDKVVDLTFSGITFKNGYTTGSGGGLYINTNGVVSISHCSFQNNYGTTEAALGVFKKIKSTTSFTHNTVLDNRSNGGNIVYFETVGDDITVTDNLFSRNEGTAVSTSTNIVFSRNTVTKSTSALWLKNADNAVCEGNTISENDGAPAIFILLNISAKVDIIGNTITANENKIQKAYGNGGGIYLSGRGDVILKNNRIEKNKASFQHHGGGVFIQDSSSLLVEDNIITGNSSPASAGGLYFNQNFSGFSAPIIRNNIIANNSVTDNNSYFGGIRISGQCGVEFLNNTITGNRSAGHTGGLYIGISGTANVYNNIIWGNTASNVPSDINLSSGGHKIGYFNTYHALSGLWNMAGNNIDVAPLFISPETGDYHLQSTSLCLDAGKNDPQHIASTDLDGNPRIINGTVDIGAYEHSTADTHPADTDNNWNISSAEFNTYSAAWKNGGTWPGGPTPVPMDYVTRAGYIVQNGGAYQNIGGGKPSCWEKQ